MAHKKGAGSTKNGRDSNAKRLGVKRFGGEKVKAISATHAKQDPHHIRARPSLIAKIRRADLIFCSGAGLEVGWLPILLQKANRTVQPGKLGYFIASEYTPVIDIPEKIDRSHGDVHPEGNPHIHLDPNNILLVAKELNRRLSLIDPGNKSYYQKQYNNFINKWEKALHWVDFELLVKSWKENSASNDLDTDRVGVFWALLFLCSQGKVEIDQKGSLFSPISLKRLLQPGMVAQLPLASLDVTDVSPAAA